MLYSHSATSDRDVVKIIGCRRSIDDCSRSFPLETTRNNNPEAFNLPVAECLALMRALRTPPLGWFGRFRPGPDWAGIRTPHNCSIRADRRMPPYFKSPPTFWITFFMVRLLISLKVS